MVKEMKRDKNNTELGYVNIYKTTASGDVTQ